MSNKKPRNKNLPEKISLFVRNYFFVLFFLTFISSVVFGFLVFYFLVFIPYEKEIDFKKEEEIVLDVDSYRSLEEKIENYQKSFNKTTEDVVSEASEEDTEESIFLENDNDDNQKDLEGISFEDLESILAQTIYEFYNFKGDRIPSIYQRSLIWKELGLGDSKDYRGDYNQNIIFLKQLKENFSKED